MSERLSKGCQFDDRYTYVGFGRESWFIGRPNQCLGLRGLLSSAIGPEPLALFGFHLHCGSTGECLPQFCSLPSMKLVPMQPNCIVLDLFRVD